MLVDILIRPDYFFLSALNHLQLESSGLWSVLIKSRRMTKHLLSQPEQPSCDALPCERLLNQNNNCLPPSAVTPYSPYWILSTDYSSVAVVYSCTDILRIFHIEYAWILGRSRFLPPETVRYAQDLLLTEGVDLFRMTATDQTGCKDD